MSEKSGHKISIIARIFQIRELQNGRFIRFYELFIVIGDFFIVYLGNEKRTWLLSEKKINIVLNIYIYIRAK